MSGFYPSAGDGRLAELAVMHLDVAACALAPGQVNEPGGVFYVGTEHVAVVVPNGIKVVLEEIRREPGYGYVSHSAVLYALRNNKMCLDFGKGKTIVRARIVFPERLGAQRVSVILIPRSRFELDESYEFNGGIQFFDPDLDCELSIPGFTPPRLIRRGTA